MVSLEQLDELEGRVLRALELISDLRSENSHLDQENQRYRSDCHELENKLKEKETETTELRRQIEETSREFQDLRGREDVLERKISDMLNRFNNTGSHTSSTPSYSSPPSSPPPSHETPPPSSPPPSYETPPPSSPPPSYKTPLETTQKSTSSSDESFVKIENDLPSGRNLTKSSISKQGGTEIFNETEEDDIIIIDDPAEPQKSPSSHTTSSSSSNMDEESLSDLPATDASFSDEEEDDWSLQLEGGKENNEILDMADPEGDDDDFLVEIEKNTS